MNAASHIKDESFLDNPVKYEAFLKWYATGLNSKNGKRSAEEAAKSLDIEASTLRAWIKEGDWEEEAAKKDAQVRLALEQAFVARILEEREDIIKRQQIFFKELYKRAFRELSKMELNLDTLLKFMKLEFELCGGSASQAFDLERAGMFRAIVTLLPTGARSELLQSLRKFRDRDGVSVSDN